MLFNGGLGVGDIYLNRCAPGISVRSKFLAPIDPQVVLPILQLSTSRLHALKRRGLTISIHMTRALPTVNVAGQVIAHAEGAGVGAD